MACTDGDDLCTAVDCVGEWQNMGECSEPCGPNGEVRQKYSIITPASGYNPQACEAEDNDEQTVNCNRTLTCPVNCVGGFDAWSTCSENCGPDGEKRRTYSVTTPQIEGDLDVKGTACPYNDGHVQIVSCNTHSCNQDCKGKWMLDSNSPYSDEARISYQTLRWEETTPKQGNGEECKWAFRKHKDNTTWNVDVNDMYETKPVTDGMKAELFVHKAAKNEDEYRARTMFLESIADPSAKSSKLLTKYCMRIPGTVTGGEYEYGTITTDAFGRDYGAYTPCFYED